MKCSGAATVIFRTLSGLSTTSSPYKQNLKINAILSVQGAGADIVHIRDSVLVICCESRYRVVAEPPRVRKVGSNGRCTLKERPAFHHAFIHKNSEQKTSSNS